MSHSPTDGGCYFSVPPATLSQRFWRRLFPTRYLDPPEDLEGFAPAYMTTEVTCHLDWRDRLRTLVSGKLRVVTQTKTDVVVNKMVSQSVVSVLRP